MSPPSAAELGRQLNDAELALVLAILRTPKSRGHRIFHRHDLDRPGTRRDLAAFDTTLEATLRCLASKGFLKPKRRHRFRCTASCNTVKHTYASAWIELVVEDVTREAWPVERRIAAIRQRVEAVADAAPAPESPPPDEDAP